MLAELRPTILTMHGYWRWVVLLTVVGALAVAILGLVRKRPFLPWGRKAGVLFVTALDMQIVLGLLLYATSEIVRSALGNFSAAMHQHEPRFFAIEHITSMLIAVALAHVGSVRIKRLPGDNAKYRAMLLWFALSLVAILIGIPWWRPFLR